MYLDIKTQENFVFQNFHRNATVPKKNAGHQTGVSYFSGDYLPRTTACAADRRAIGTRKGEQLT
jgi:hypothetical protein